MRPVVTHQVAWSVDWSVCRSVTVVSLAKTTEPIDMPFGLWTPVGLGNHVLDGIQIPHGNGQFLGKGETAAIFLVNFDRLP